MTNTAPITLQTLFRYYKNLPHQAAAIKQLEEDLIANGYDVALRRDRPWFNTWSQDGKQIDLSPAIKLIQQFEGCHLDAYLCPAGVATIGWGNTRYADGRPVKLGDKITRVEADLLLSQEVDRIVARLGATVPHWRAMSDNQKGALISFAYNLGAGFYGAKGFETISRVLEQRQWGEVPDAMLLYRNPGSKFEAGLRRRRVAEGRLWAEGTVGRAVQQLPYTVKPSDPFSTRLSANFTLGEFALGQPARRFHHQHQVDTAGELAAFLERVRVAFGNKRITITAGIGLPRSIGQWAARLAASTCTTHQALVRLTSTLTAWTSMPSNAGATVNGRFHWGTAHQKDLSTLASGAEGPRSDGIIRRTSLTARTLPAPSRTTPGTATLGRAGGSYRRTGPPSIPALPNTGSSGPQPLHSQNT
jgi:GH24 family phage-related lysozyme (muramidase)